MAEQILAILLAVCSVMGFVNVYALWKAKALVGVSLMPTIVYAGANIVQAYMFMSDGRGGAAFGSLLCLAANTLWLGLAIAYRPRRPRVVAYYD